MSTPQSSPKLPFDPSVPQPTPIERATVEGKWNDQTIQQRWEMLKTDMKNHPELAEWFAKRIVELLVK